MSPRTALHGGRGGGRTPLHGARERAGARTNEAYSRCAFFFIVASRSEQPSKEEKDKKATRLQQARLFRKFDIVLCVGSRCKRKRKEGRTKRGAAGAFLSRGWASATNHAPVRGQEKGAFSIPALYRPVMWRDPRLINTPPAFRTRTARRAAAVPGGCLQTAGRQGRHNRPEDRQAGQGVSSVQEATQDSKGPRRSQH